MKITIVDGHPDKSDGRFCHALAAAYSDGAKIGGHETKLITLANITVPILRSREHWEKGQPSDSIQKAQKTLAWADHIVFIYPLWLGDLPAYFKAFLEQVARPNFAFTSEKDMQKMRPSGLKGKSARIIVTMGMPGWFYKWFFLEHSLKSFKRNILGFVGVKPVRETIIGMVESTDHEKWLTKVRLLGQNAR